jgi:hypothetical protein
MNPAVLYICGVCYHVARLRKPSTRWGRLPACPHCHKIDWRPAKQLFDNDDHQLPLRKENGNEPNET